MGAYSTLRITRGHAIKLVLGQLLTQIDNQMLERMVDEMLRIRLYNCVIVPDGYEPNDDKEAYLW